MKDKRVVFMGTPDFAVPVLKKLIENTNVVLVVSQPDKKVGRDRELKMTPIKEEALKHNIPVFQPIKIREDYNTILDANPDIIITCAYGQIIPDILLETPKYKAINVHASLLPKLRGGAPIHKAIMYGYEKTGITVMYMASKMDAGDIISTCETKIEDNDNLETLHDRLSIMGADLLIETLPSIFEGTNKRIKQDEAEVTYAYNVSREEEKLDFNKTSKEVYNHIRSLYPFPTSYLMLDEKIIKITGAYIGKTTTSEPGVITNIYKDGFGISTKDNEIIITSLKPEGKKEMKASDYLNGVKKEEFIGKRVK